jgi:hypothetical protein
MLRREQQPVPNGNWVSLDAPHPKLLDSSSVTSLPEFKNWLTHGWGIEAKTPQQALDLISHIALLAKGRTYAWRGQSDATYKLSSSLYRRIENSGEAVSEKALRTEEIKILEEARRWGLGRDLGPSATDLHLLALLQHHGVPTRLLDVTSNPITALWFAAEQHAGTNGGDVPIAGEKLIRA